jgi:hypothetical protein
MTIFHSRQSGDARRTRKKENADTFNITSQIPPSICAVMHTKHDKRDATIFKSLCKRTAVSKCFYRVEALPLVWTRILRLANSSPKTARSLARRSRDGRETSGKKSSEISRVISAQRPGNGRTVATAMPLNVRQDDSQDDLPCAWTWPRHVRAGNLRDNSQHVRATANATSHKQLVGFLAVSFNHDNQKL